MSDHQQDQQTSALFHEAAADLTTDVDVLVSGGVSRGRVLRRRRRAGTTLAAAAVIGVIGVAASVGPRLVGDASSAPAVGFADRDGAQDPRPTTAAESPSPQVDTEPAPQPATPDRPITVAAPDIPATVAGLLPEGELGEIRKDAGFPLLDQAQHKIVHFMWDGTLTTFIIERADSLATCEEQVAPEDQADGVADGRCVVEGGIELLISGPTTAEQVTGQGVSAWTHGYIVTAMSYNADEGKGVAPVTAEPPISLDLLTMLATSDVWFE